MNTWIGVPLCAFGAYRIARAIAHDDISRRPRTWLFHAGYPLGLDGGRLHPWDWAYGLVSCPFCIGFWVSVGLYLAWVQRVGIHEMIGALATAGGQAYLAAREPS